MVFSTALPPAGCPSASALPPLLRLPANGEPPQEAGRNENWLVQRLLARDERALRLLHDRYAANLLAVVLRCTTGTCSKRVYLRSGSALAATPRSAAASLPEWCACAATRPSMPCPVPATASIAAFSPPETGGAQLAPAASTFTPEHIVLPLSTVKTRARAALASLTRFCA